MMIDLNTTSTPRLRDLTEAADYLATVLAPLLESGVRLPDLDAPALLARAFVSHPDGTLTPRPWASDIEQLTTALTQHASPPGAQRQTAHPCPAWCEDNDSDHPHLFTYSDPDARGLHAVDNDDTTPEGAPRALHGLYRVHRHRHGPNLTHVAVEARERIARPDAQSDYGTDPEAVTVAVYGPARSSHRLPGHLTPDGARELARQLLAAADLADTERRRTHQRCEDVIA